MDEEVYGHKVAEGWVVVNVVDPGVDEDRDVVIPVFK